MKKSIIILTAFILISAPFSSIPIHAQTGSTSETLYNRRIVWREDVNTFRYRVDIDISNNGTFRRHLSEYTTTTFFVVSLPTGEYRFRIIPYDILDRPAQGTDWVRFEVRHPVVQDTGETVPVMEIVEINVIESNEQSNLQSGTINNEQETENDEQGIKNREQVFSNINIGGSFELMAHLARGETWNDDDPRTGMERDMIITIGAETENNKFGMKGALVRNANWWVYAWWKPVEFFMIKTGAIYEENSWATTDITGEGFQGPHANKLNVKPTEDYAGIVLRRETGFLSPAMTDLQKERALQLSFFPLKGLTVNFGFPMDRSAFNNMAEYNYIYKLHAQIAYEIDGIGEAAFSFINAPDAPDEYKNIFAQWKMPIGDFFKLELGINYALNSEITAPLNIGLGLGLGELGRDLFVMNLRAGASIPMEDTQDTNIGTDIVLICDFDFIRLYLPIGIGINMPYENENNLYWSFSPYVAKNLGGPYFYAGIQFYNGIWASGRPTSTEGINWSIPLGFRWDF